MTRLFALCLATALSTGCATVQSTHAANSTTAEGMTYFLPLRHVKLTATKEKLDAPKIKTALDAKSKDLDAAKAAATAAEQNAKAKAAIVAALPADAAASTRDTAVQASQLAQAEAAIAAANKDALNSTVNGLKKMLEAAQVAPEGSCGYTAKLELLPAQGDRKMRFVAKPRHSALRDDSVKLAVTQDGLLSSSNVIAADRTGDIIVELAGAIAGLSGSPVGVQGLDGGSPATNCDEHQKIVTIFDPASERGYATVNNDLSEAGYPLRLAWMNKFGPGESPTFNGSMPPATDVIFYRTPVPTQIRISECKPAGCSAGDVVIEDVLVSVPQAGPVSYIPQRSSAFVRTVNDVQFDNGVIKSWSADRPSEVLEVVRLPVRILTAVVSVPASLIQLRVNHDTQSKNLAEIQAAERAASVKLQILQMCLASAGDDAAAAKGCLSQ